TRHGDDRQRASTEGDRAFDCAAGDEIVEHVFAVRPADHAVVAVAGDRLLRTEHQLADRERKAIAAVVGLGEAGAVEVELELALAYVDRPVEDLVGRRDAALVEDLEHGAVEPGVARSPPVADALASHFGRAGIDARLGEIGLDANIT